MPVAEDFFASRSIELRDFFVVAQLSALAAGAFLTCVDVSIKMAERQLPLAGRKGGAAAQPRHNPAGERLEALVARGGHGGGGGGLLADLQPAVDLPYLAAPPAASSTVPRAGLPCTAPQ